MFVRFQGAAPDRLGRAPGVFTLLDALLASGGLAPDAAAWWRTTRAAHAAHVSPITDGTASEDERTGARSWYRADAAQAIALAAAAGAVCERHGVPVVELRTAEPGRIVHEDETQVVALSHAAKFTRPQRGLGGHGAADDGLREAR